MRKVLRGVTLRAHMAISFLLARSLFRIAKTNALPRERRDQRHLVSQGATIFKKEIVR